MDRFLDKYQHLFTEAYYNARLGGPEPGTSHSNPKWDEVWRQLKQYRADVILVGKQEKWICEVTTRLGPRALGQILVYYYLYLQDPVLGPEIKPTIIYETTDDDLLAVVSRIKLAIQPIAV